MFEKPIHAEEVKSLGSVAELQDFMSKQMIQIPLEAYRRYIECTIKGPTVEIPLEEYNRLKMDNEELRHILERRDFENGELRAEISRREDVASLIKQEHAGL